MRTCVLLILSVCAGAALAAQPPSVFGPDAPQLAPLGAMAVGVRTLHLVQHGQIDVLAFDAARGTAPSADRGLTVDLWYPAQAPKEAPRVQYTAQFPSEPPAPAASFTVPGIAVRDAAAMASRWPLVVVSHGYSNDPAAMTWLTENLASKGYVVAAIHHEDPPITDRARFVGPLMRRPLDIAFVAATLQHTLNAEHLIDPARTALIGYSMGGYGVLTAAGATLDPAGVAARMVPGGLMMRYVRGGTASGELLVKGLRAVVAIAPAGAGSLSSWGEEGLTGILAPLLLIQGDNDRTVDYRAGALAIFERAVHAHRFLLTFKEGGHSIGLSPAPESMRGILWNQDWFEDPVWRKERVNAINAHFITAFLDVNLKDDASRAAYLKVPTSDSDAGVWPADAHLPYDAYSPASGDISVWKGFQRNHSTGLSLREASALAP